MNEEISGCEFRICDAFTLFYHNLLAAVFALFILQFVVAVGFLIGVVILAINRILKRNPALIIGMIIGIVIAGCVGVIGYNNVDSPVTGLHRKCVGSPLKRD